MEVPLYCGFMEYGPHTPLVTFWASSIEHIADRFKVSKAQSF